MTVPFDIEPFVHPDLRHLLPQLSVVLQNGPLTLELLATMRAGVPPFLPGPAATPAWEWRTIPGPPDAPDLRVLLIDPEPSPRSRRPAILHMHGGGYVGGSAEGSLWRTQALARELGALVVSVEYRLAPETRYPGAREDNYDALAWLHASADALMVDRDRIALVGDSAGGGHAATLAGIARDRGEFAIAGQALVYPMLDDRTGSTDRKPPHMGAVLWDEQRNRFGWAALLGVAAGGDEVPSAAVPSRAPDLSDLPPTWIGVGSIDLFLDEDVEFARRLASVGIPVRLNVVPGAFHLFDAFDVGVSRVFRADLVDWLRATLG